MKMNYPKLIFFILSQVALIFIHIYKHNLFIQTSFKLQTFKKTRTELLNEIGRIENEFYKEQSKSIIQHYAEKELGMKPLQLKSIIKANGERP